MGMSNYKSIYEHENAVTQTPCYNCMYYYSGFCKCHNEYVTSHEQETEECEDHKVLEKSIYTMNGKSR